MFKLKAIAALTVTVLVYASGPIDAAQPAIGPHESPAQVVFDDSTGGITSDLGGLYQTGSEGTVCKIQTGGNIELDARNTPRSVTFAFGNLSPFPSNPRPEHAFLSTAVWNESNGNFGGFTDMAIGATRSSHIQVRFYDPAYANTEWRLNFNYRSGNGTSPLYVTRTGADTWTIENPQAIGKLTGSPTNTKGPSTQFTDYGLFSLPLRFYVTRLAQ